MTLCMPRKNVDVPEEIEDGFEKFAKLKGTSKDSLIISVLEEWLEDQEDIARADEVMTGIRAGTVKILSSEEVSKRLGLEN